MPEPKTIQIDATHRTALRKLVRLVKDNLDDVIYQDERDALSAIIDACRKAKPNARSRGKPPMKPPIWALPPLKCPHGTNLDIAARGACAPCFVDGDIFVAVQRAQSAYTAPSLTNLL